MKKILPLITLAGLFACSDYQSDTKKVPQVTKKVAKVPLEQKATPQLSASIPKVFFKNIKTGDTLSNPIKIQFGIEGMTVRKAGQLVEGSGHHHLLIDVADIDLTKPIPSNESHKHFGGGQTEVEMTLKPGPHNLKMLFANGVHIPHSKPLMAEVEIFVK